MKITFYISFCSPLNPIQEIEISKKKNTLHDIFNSKKKLIYIEWQPTLENVRILALGICLGLALILSIKFKQKRSLSNPTEYDI